MTGHSPDETAADQRADDQPDKIHEQNEVGTDELAAVLDEAGLYAFHGRNAGRPWRVEAARVRTLLARRGYTITAAPVEDAPPVGEWDVLRAAAGRAATEYSRSGAILDADVLDDELAEIADKATGTLIEYWKAATSGHLRDIEFPLAALCDLLAVVAALRGALNYTPTGTGVDAFTQFQAESVSTREHDQLRLHLLAVHGAGGAPCMADWEADVHHIDRHGAGDYGAAAGHGPDEHTWDHGLIANRIAEIPGAATRGFVTRAVADVVDRHTTGAELPEGGAGSRG